MDAPRSRLLATLPDADRGLPDPEVGRKRFGRSQTAPRLGTPLSLMDARALPRPPASQVGCSCVVVSHQKQSHQSSECICCICCIWYMHQRWGKDGANVAKPAPQEGDGSDEDVRPATSLPSSERASAPATVVPSSRASRRGARNNGVRRVMSRDGVRSPRDRAV